MIQGSKLSSLLQINTMLNLAKSGRDSFLNDISNYIVSEFEVYAIAVFKLENKSALLLGNSTNVKKSFQLFEKYNLDDCAGFSNTDEFFVHKSDNCNILISDIASSEISLTFRANIDTTIFVKIAQRNDFLPNDVESIKSLGKFLKNIIQIWLDSRNGIVSSEKTIFALLNETTNEIRTLSNSIVGSTSIIDGESLSPTSFSYLSTIKENSHKLLATVNDFSELIKIYNQEIQIKQTDVEIKKLLKETIDILNSKLHNSNVSFRLILDDTIPDKISVDAAKLQSAINLFLTILAKIIKIGTITIEGSFSSNNLIELKISDKSNAAFANFTNQILQPFGIQNLLEKTSLISGLSLFYVAKLISSIGGKLIFSENSVNGNSFLITIQPQFESKVKSQLEMLPMASPDLNSILVIEDDYATSKLLTNYLIKWGYEPTIVNNEEKTFQMLNAKKFLAVILDIELPEINGMELLRKINNHPNMKNVPVIVCSVEVEEQKAFMMGAMEYFSKPINYNHLVEVLQSYKLRKNSTILCVDDDVPTLNLVSQAISTAGFKPLAEHISSRVIDLIMDKDIDLAIFDLDMPHPNGFELIKMVKSIEKFKNLPIIIYTGKENFGDDLREVEGLFDELLSKKSTNIEDLAETIKSMIHRYEEPKTVEEVVEETNDEAIKILFAEDYKHSQIIVTRLLKKNGFENIAIVENGEEALKLAEKEKFDIILMDMQMPIMNGFEAIDRIRKIQYYKDIPIISLTAFAMKGDREKCLDAGATDYIPKPIDSKEFIEKIKYYAQLK